jgi:hypothetical protein
MHSTSGKCRENLHVIAKGCCPTPLVSRRNRRSAFHFLFILAASLFQMAAAGVSFWNLSQVPGVASARLCQRPSCGVDACAITR